MKLLHSFAYMVTAMLAVCVAELRPAHALNILIADDYYDGLDSDLYLLPEALSQHQVTYLPNLNEDTEQPELTSNLAVLQSYDLVIFYASGIVGLGRPLTSEEFDALEAYIQGGGNLIITGYDVLVDPADSLMINLSRSLTAGDELRVTGWTAAALDHFILRGPYGDFRGRHFEVSSSDHDKLKADPSRGALSLGSLDISASDKIVFTWLGLNRGSVGVWNGNDGADDWVPEEYADGQASLAVLQNWLAGLEDPDEDRVPAFADACPLVSGVAQGPAPGCPQSSQAPDPEPTVGGRTDCSGDRDQDGVLNCEDECPDEKGDVRYGGCNCRSEDLCRGRVLSVALFERLAAQMARLHYRPNRLASKLDREKRVQKRLLSALTRLARLAKRFPALSLKIPVERTRRLMSGLFAASSEHAFEARRQALLSRIRAERERLTLL